MSAELKPCPFCGSAIRIESNRDWHNLVGAHGKNCILDHDETMKVSANEASKTWLIKAWNLRQAPAQGELSALPDLPEPEHVSGSSTIDEWTYTAEQMRAYGQACRDAERVSAAQWKALYDAAVTIRGQGVSALPKWIDDQKGKDHGIDALIEYIERSGQGVSDAADAGALGIACTVNKKLGDVLAGRSYLLPDDLAALKRFYECATDFDSGGHDVSREAMRRLTEIGVCRHLGFGNHTTTSFGDYVLERAEGEPVKLPLKTLVERNADAAILAQANGGGK